MCDPILNHTHLNPLFHTEKRTRSAWGGVRRFIRRSTEFGRNFRSLPFLFLL